MLLRHRPARIHTSMALIVLIVLTVLGSCNPLPVESPSEPSPEVTSPPSPATLPGVTSTSPSGTSETWWEVYFTDPRSVNNPEDWQGSIEGRLIDQIDAAQESIHIASFEFDLTPVAEALIAAKQRGVDVRWVTDNENGIEADTEPGHGQFKMLQDAGIDVRADTRSALMHNKFWVFDGETAWTGSTNITESGIFQQNNNTIMIHSPEVAAIFEREFEEMWDGKFGPRSPSTAGEQSLTVNGTPIQIYFSPEDKVLDHLIPVVSGAQSNIRFMAFSFTDYDLAKAMIDRAAAGTDVAGIYEKVGSETQGSEMRTFYCAHVPVRQDGNPKFLHDKVIVVDNHIVISGSFNFSSNATENNDENVIIIDNPEIAKLYMDEFDRLWSIATDLDPAKFSCS